MKLFKDNLDTKEKIFIGLFCIFSFWAANTVQFYGSSCYSSPCNATLNDTDADSIIDYSGDSNSNFLLAPFNLLAPKLLNLNGDYKIMEGFQFDQSHEILEPGSELGISDSKALFHAFLIIKLITLLNLPWWIMIGILLVKLNQKIGMTWGSIIIILFISFLLFFKVLLSLELYYGANFWDLLSVYLGYSK